ncbi:alpha/beta hydrolase [Azoarcus taiwanensis]|uniref:Alpha/beta fold hydrolase n=1 Tax=Azoarcus taiwanensis TaxID=666964 RepID=A0A972J9D9_9RHOO|nr:alpha/beta hydrolase [Azoarcus taiwanensis]NMG04416.1 alpha/beta fold hydrolase [Azoarcus taiwanensis]
MNRSRFGDLEVIARGPTDGPGRGTPLLFVHGAYTAAWCWDEHFLPYFAGLGYNCYAVSLSGHGGSRKTGYLDGFSLADYVNDVAEAVQNLPAPPVLIGHSMGGMVVQKYLEGADAPAAVLLCSVPPQGLMGSALGLMMSKPGLLNDLNRILGGGQPHPESLREALFHQPIDADILLRYYHRCQPESHRAIWDMTLFNLPHTARMNRPPLLVVGAEHDHLIPPAQVRMTGVTYDVDPVILPGMGHGVMLEAGWRLAADTIADWLADTLP